MSDNRKILVAKRKNERGKCTNLGDNFRNKQGGATFKKGVKRPVPINNTTKKNLANDRLKKLRTAINDEAQNSLSQSNAAKASNGSKQKMLSMRKRPQSTQFQDILESKVSRNMCESMSNVVGSTSKGDSAFHFKEEVLSQTHCFTTTTLNPFTVTNAFQAASADDTEDMEWSTADDIEATTQNTFNSAGVVSNNTFKVLSNNSNKTNFFIVVDTNIFISQMQLIKNIVEMDITENRKAVIFIPWMVIEELDFIKEDSNKNSLKWKAQEAIKFIEKALSSKNDRIIGQTLNEVNEQKDTGKNQDNKIIACCLQVLEKYGNMVLLTDDVNLRNKAHINQIPTCSRNEIMLKIPLALNNQTKAQIIFEKMTSLCCNVIRESAKSAYGQAANKMTICRSTPQSLQDCIKVFRKYWFPVFQELLMKQFKKSIDDLSKFLTANKSIKDDSNELNELLRLCVRVCIFLKDVKCCKNTIESTIRDLNNIKDS